MEKEEPFSFFGRLGTEGPRIIRSIGEPVLDCRVESNGEGEGRLDSASAIALTGLGGERSWGDTSPRSQGNEPCSPKDPASFRSPRPFFNLPSAKEQADRPDQYRQLKAIFKPMDGENVNAPCERVCSYWEPFLMDYMEIVGKMFSCFGRIMLPPQSSLRFRRKH